MCCCLLRGLQSWFCARDNLHVVQELLDSVWGCVMAEEGSAHSQAGVPAKRALINKSLLLFVWVLVCYIHKESFEQSTE